MGDIAPFLGWLAIALGAAVAGLIVVVAVRRWAQREQPHPTFTFQDLRDMQARGEITNEEFVRMRNALLAKLEIDGLDGDVPPDAPPTEPPGSSG